MTLAIPKMVRSVPASLYCGFQDSVRIGLNSFVANAPATANGITVASLRRPSQEKRFHIAKTVRRAGKAQKMEKAIRWSVAIFKLSFDAMVKMPQSLHAEGFEHQHEIGISWGCC